MEESKKEIIPQPESAEPEPEKKVEVAPEPVKVEKSDKKKVRKKIWVTVYDNGWFWPSRRKIQAGIASVQLYIHGDVVEKSLDIVLEQLKTFKAGQAPTEADIKSLHDKIAMIKGYINDESS